MAVPRSLPIPKVAAAVSALDRPADDHEAEARAFPGSLGGEKGISYAIDNFRRDAPDPRTRSMITLQA